MGVIIYPAAELLRSDEYRLSHEPGIGTSDLTDASTAFASFLARCAGRRGIIDKVSWRSRYLFTDRKTASFTIQDGTRLEFEIPLDFSEIGPPTTSSGTGSRKTYITGGGSVSGTTVSLSDDVAIGEDVLSLPTGAVAANGLAVGNWLLLKSDAKYPRGYAYGYSAEQVLIKDISGDDVQLAWAVSDNYDVADNASVALISHAHSIGIENPYIIGTGRPTSVAGDSGIQLSWAANSVVKGGQLVDVDYNGVRLYNALNCRVEGISCRMPQPGANTNVQYGVAVLDASQDCIVSGVEVFGGKHAVAQSVSVGGITRRLVIENCKIYDTWSSCSAVHENCERVSWIGNEATRCNSGFDVRSAYALLARNIIRDLYDGNEGIGVELSRRTVEVTLIDNIIEGGRFGVRLTSSTGYQLSGSEGPCRIRLQGGRITGANTRSVELSLDLLNNGRMTSDFGWTKDGSWNFESTVVGSVLATGYRHTPGSTTTLSQSVTYLDGETYRVLFNIYGRTAGSVSVRLSGGTPVSGTSRTVDGQYTEDLTVNGNTGFEFVPSSTFDGIIDRVAVYRVVDGEIIHYDLEINGLKTNESLGNSILVNGPFARGKIINCDLNGVLDEPSPQTSIITYNAQDFIIANNTYADHAAPYLDGTNVRGYNNVDITDTANPWANLDEYATVNPTAAGLALLDDASPAAQMTTLGISSNGQSLITASNYAAMNILLHPSTAQTSSFSVPTSGVGAVYNNTGASALVVASLPAATTSRRYAFIVTNTKGIQIAANGSDTIRLGSTLHSTLLSTVVGDFIELVSTGTGTWTVTTSRGIWRPTVKTWKPDVYARNVVTAQAWATATTPTNGWNNVCWAAALGLFVAVGGSGTGNRVMTSPDGVTWTNQTSAEDNTWNGVCWSPELSLFVAVSSNGTNRVMTSPDGVTWTSQTAAEANQWLSVCWSPELGLFVAVSISGTGNRVMTSSDGVTWAARTSAADNDWRDVCWSPELGLFCAVAITGTGNRVMTSPDGVTWTSRTSAADNNWRGVCWSPDLGLFVAVSGSGTGDRVMTSPDGVTWTARTSAADRSWQKVCWSPALGVFCAVASGGTSTDVQRVGSLSGIYTPTLTNETNLAASTAYATRWLRVVDMITVFGRVNVDPTTTGQTQLGMSLPVPSAFTAEEHCGGVANSKAVAGFPASIFADATNDRARFEWIAIDTAARDLNFNFSYRIVA